MSATPNPGTPRMAPSVTMPPYTQGLSVETERDLATFVTRYHVSLHLARSVDVADDIAMRGAEYAEMATRESVSKCVRQMQDEAVTALGLNHWRDEIRRELRSQELNERSRILRTLRDAVRAAPSMDAAALLIQDEIDAQEAW